MYLYVYIYIDIHPDGLKEFDGEHLNPRLDPITMVEPPLRR